MSIVITKQPQDMRVDVNTSVVFSVEATGTELTYQWQYKDTGTTPWTDSTLTGYNTPNMTVLAETRRNGYKYRCIISDSDGESMTSDEAILYINETGSVVTIIKQPENQLKAVDETVTLSVEATGVASYLWQYNYDGTRWYDLTWETADSANMTFTTTENRMSWQYRCKLTGTDNSVVYTDVIYFVPVLITKQPDNVTALVGDMVTFTVEAEGDGLTYQWQWLGGGNVDWRNTSVTGNQTDTITLEATDARNGYQYRCTIYDVNGNFIHSDVATLTVVPILITKQPENVTVAVNTNAIFTVEVEGVDLTYQWQYRTNPNGSWWDYPSSGTNKTLTVYANDYKNGYSYRCNIADANGNTVTSDVAMLTVVPLLITKQPENVTAAVGETVTFSVEATGAVSYQWQYSTGGGNYWNTLTWTGNTTATTNGTLTNQNIAYLFRCELTDANGNKVYTDVCRPIGPIVVTQWPKSTTVANGKTASFTFEATGTNLKYRWQYRETTDGTFVDTTLPGYNTNTLSFEADASMNKYQYRCVITDGANNRVQSAAITLTVVDILITKQPENFTAAIDETAVFSVSADGNGLTYQWQWKNSTMSDFENTANPGYNTETLSVPATAGRNDCQYHCVITNASGNTVTSDAATLYIKANIITQPQNQAAVAGDTVTFSVEATGVKTYRWQVLGESGNWNDLGWDGCDQPTMTHEMNINNIQYQYRCKLIGLDGNTVYTDVIHFAPVIITKQPTNATGAIGDTVTFSLEASGNISMYRWQQSTDDGSTWNLVYWGNSGFDTNTFTFTVSDESRLNALYRCCVYCADGDEYNVISDIVRIASTPIVITKQPVDAEGKIKDSVSFKVEATGVVSYQWQYKKEDANWWGNLTDESATTEELSFVVTVTRLTYAYRCKLTDAAGNVVYTDEVKIVEPIVITKQPEDVTAVIGNTATFAVEASGSGLTYQWQWAYAGGTVWYDSTNAYATQATFHVEAAENRNGLQYRCIITGAAGNTVTSNGATLTVVPILITKQPENITASIGAKVKFTVAAEGEGLTYQWEYRQGESSTYWSNSTSTGTTTNELTLVAKEYQNGYLYRCLITDQNGNTVTSDTATLNITSNIITQPTNITAASGSTFTFAVEATGVAAYQWQYGSDGSKFYDLPANDQWASAKTNTLEVAIDEYSIAWYYRCKLTGLDGSTKHTDVVYFIVKTPNNVTATSINDNSIKVTWNAVEYAIGYKIHRSLTYTGGYSEVATIENGAIVEWTDTGLSAGPTYYYYMRAIAPNGTFSSNSYKTSAAIVSSVIIKQPEDVCTSRGNTVTFNIKTKGEGLTYQWQWRESDSANWENTSLPGNQTDTITVEAIDERNGYQYRCIVEDNFGNKITSEKADLIIIPMLLTKYPEDTRTFYGHNAVFSVEAEGADLVYQWKYKETPADIWENITTATSAEIGSSEIYTSELVIKAAEKNDGYLFACIIAAAEIGAPNLFDISTETKNVYINNNNGTTVENSNYNCSAFIKVDAGKTLVLTSDRMVATNLRWAQYDTNKNYISGGIHEHILQLSSGAEYVRFSYPRDWGRISLRSAMYEETTEACLTCLEPLQRYDIGVGFEFDGIHCDEMHCELANHDECMHAMTEVFTGMTETVDGYRGEYYTGESVSGRDFELELLVEDADEATLLDIGEWLDAGKSGKLIFDHVPYKYYLARVMSEPQKALYVGFDHKRNMFTYSGKISVRMKAIRPRAYMVDKMRKAYPTLGNLLNTVEAGSGIIREEIRPLNYGTGNLLIYNAGNADAEPEIWISGRFSSGTKIKNETTGQEMVIRDGGGSEKLYCIDSALGRTTVWTNAQHPVTEKIHAANMITGKCSMADYVKSGNFIKLKSCYPRWREMKVICDGTGTILSDAPVTRRMVGKYICIGDKWYKITSANGNTIVVAGSPSAGEWEAFIGGMNEISIIPGPGDSVTQVTVYCRDTFY